MQQYLVRSFELKLQTVDLLLVACKINGLRSAIRLRGIGNRFVLLCNTTVFFKSVFLCFSIQSMSNHLVERFCILDSHTYFSLECFWYFCFGAFVAFLSILFPCLMPGAQNSVTFG